MPSPVAPELLKTTSRRQFALLAAGVAITACSGGETAPGAASGAGAGPVEGNTPEGGVGGGGSAAASADGGSAGKSATGGGSAGKSATGGSSASGTASAHDSAGEGNAAGSSASQPDPGANKSRKRGIAYNALTDGKDFEALASGVSWWYDWGTKPGAGSSAALRQQYGMDFMPMVWGKDFKDSEIVALLLADPEIRYLLVLNEPNLGGQANLSPAAAAALWPRIEQIADSTSVKIVGPQITWGNQMVDGNNYGDPAAWLDAFYAAYQADHGGQDPRIDYLGFHWYDYGLAGQLDRLTRFGKPYWVTELANWHTGDGSAAIDTLDEQKAQMTEMIGICEARDDVFRYAWFTGRLGANDKDVHYTSLLAETGKLTALGELYVSLPFASQ
jgi:hypothetical protein